MDLCLGGSLYTEMKKRTKFFNRTEIQIVISRYKKIYLFFLSKIMRNLISSLVYIHSKGVIHRDLKPENILFLEKGDFSTLKIADFGLSAFEKEFPYLYPKCGTPGFVAPEGCFKAALKYLS